MANIIEKIKKGKKEREQKRELERDVSKEELRRIEAKERQNLKEEKEIHSIKQNVSKLREERKKLNSGGFGFFNSTGSTIKKEGKKVNNHVLGLVPEEGKRNLRNQGFAGLLGSGFDMGGGGFVPPSSHNSRKSGKTHYKRGKKYIKIRTKKSHKNNSSNYDNGLGLGSFGGKGGFDIWGNNI